MRTSEKLILRSRALSEFDPKARRLVERADWLATNAVLATIAAAVMFAVTLVVTRDLGAATVAGSPVVVAVALAAWALASRLRGERLQLRGGGGGDGRGRDAGLAARGPSMDGAVM
jgi:hypothetical protein